MKEKRRCAWCVGNTLYETYHDEEWGVPVTDDNLLFEFLILETFQAGLSWLTILKKRDNFRTAFDDFDYRLISRYDEAKVQSLMQDTGIIRNQLKIRAAISNAQAFIAVLEEFGSFSTYIWKFVGNKPVQNNWITNSKIPASTETSMVLSKDLKKRGFKFVGPTVVYAHMQATGMVNDHIQDCFRYQEVKALGDELNP